MNYSSEGLRKISNYIVKYAGCCGVNWGYMMKVARIVASEDSNLAACCSEFDELCNKLDNKIIEYEKLVEASLEGFIEETLANERKAAVDVTEINEKFQTLSSEIDGISF